MISELRHRDATARVVMWAQAHPPESFYLSVLSLGEIRKGIERARDATFRLRLIDWLEVELPRYFLGRILDIDSGVADCWGQMQATVKRTPPAVDGLIAATASRHHLSLVTRNTADFEGLGVKLINPWSPA